MVTIYEDDLLYSTTNLSHVDIFRSAKSVDWSRKIDGLAFWKEMTIIFQGINFVFDYSSLHIFCFKNDTGNSFISIQCKNGRWVEIVHKSIDGTFPRITSRSLTSSSVVDSVVVRKNSPTADEDQATVVMFYGHEFFECSITGSDVSI